MILTFTVAVTFESISVTIAGSPETSCLLSGSDATVTCNVEGFPRPEIDFLIGEVLVVPGAGSFDRVTRTEADQILVENVGMADEGSYGCRVANDSTAPITTADFQHCSESSCYIYVHVRTYSGTSTMELNQNTSLTVALLYLWSRLEVPKHVPTVAVVCLLSCVQPFLLLPRWQLHRQRLRRV